MKVIQPQGFFLCDPGATGIVVAEIWRGTNPIAMSSTAVAPVALAASDAMHATASTTTCGLNAREGLVIG